MNYMQKALRKTNNKLFMEDAAKKCQREEAFALKSQGEQLWCLANWHKREGRFESFESCRSMALDCAREATRLADSITS